MRFKTELKNVRTFQSELHYEESTLLSFPFSL